MKRRLFSLMCAVALILQSLIIFNIPAAAWSWSTDGKYQVASYDVAIVKNGSIVLDAERDHDYLASTRISEYPDISPYTRSGYSSVVGNAKGNFEAYVVVDTTGMFIYAEIKDSTIFPTLNTNGNDGDYLSVYFDWIEDHPDPDDRDSSWSASTYLSTYGKNQNLGWLSADYYGNIKGSKGFANYTAFGPNKNQSVIYKSRITDDGWACEWFVPWKDKAQSDAIAKGEQIPCGIGFQVGDDSDINDTATPGKEQDVVIRFDQRKEIGLNYYIDYSTLSNINFVKGHEETQRVCTASGKADTVCEECDIVVKENVAVSIPAGTPESHVYILSDQSTEASCTENGKTIFECKYCDAVREETVDASGHDCEYNAREAKHICKNCRVRIDHGDVDTDGDITNADVLEIYRYIYNPTLYPIDLYDVADADFDGDITNADALVLYRYIFNSELYPIVEKRDPIMIGEIDISKYVIVYPQSNSLGEKKLAEELAARVKNKYGIEIEVYPDSVDTFEYEILVGRVDRDESRAVYLTSFDVNAYSIIVGSKKIIVGFADDKFTAGEAIEDLGNMMTVSCSIISKTGKALANKILTSACFSDMHNTFTMLEPTNSTGDYVLRKTHVRAVELIKERYGLVDVVLVGGDLMSDYPSWNKSGWWPYKYYVEYKQLLVDLFGGLAKDGKVMYVAGNHDYAQGELSTDGPGIGGSYNSSEFYFTGPMITTMGVLDEKDMHKITGTHTGEEYLLGYHYEVNGVHFIGLAPDPDNPNVWSSQGYGFHDDTIKWFKNILEEIDPNGDEIIFVNCHFPLAYRENDVIKGGTSTEKDFLEIIKGHSNLFWMFGHLHTGEQEIAQSHTSEMIVHYDSNGNVVSSPAIAESYGNASDRGPTSVYMGAGRIDYNSKYFGTDKVYGYGGYSSSNNTYNTTATPTICQVMYFTVYEDRVEFQSINVGTYPGYTENDMIVPYTVYLYR